VRPRSADGLEVLSGPVKVPIEGDILRLVTDGVSGWVETWNGSAWVEGGSAVSMMGARSLTDEELVRLGIVKPDPSKPMPRCF
jgi:hypothetical protein